MLTLLAADEVGDFWRWVLRAAAVGVALALAEWFNRQMAQKPPMPPTKSGAI